MSFDHKQRRTTFITSVFLVLRYFGVLHQSFINSRPSQYTSLSLYMLTVILIGNKIEPSSYTKSFDMILGSSGLIFFFSFVVFFFSNLIILILDFSKLYLFRDRFTRIMNYFTILLHVYFLHD